MASIEPIVWGGDEEKAAEYIILGVPRDEDGKHTERLSFTRSRYHQIAATDGGWREADTTTDDFGSTVFQSAGLLDDGTLVGRTVSRGRSRREASLRVESDGRWSSVVESGPVKTEAHGRLRAPDEPIKLRRTRSRGSELLWTADAVTEFDVAADDGTRITRRTTGKIKYPGGGTGTFRTDYLGTSVDEGRFRSSSGAWQPVPGLGPGQTGSQSLKKLPGGPGNTEWERSIHDLKTGASQVDHRIDRQGTEADGNFHVRVTEKTTVISGGKKTETSTVDHTWNDAGGTHWERITTGSGGRQAVERGEFVVSGGAASVSKSTTNPDKSTTIESTTWDTETGLGQRHTTTTAESGEVLSDTTEQGKGDMWSHQHRPGDNGSYFQPAPATGGEEKKDDDTDKDKDKDDKGDKEEQGGGGDETETSDDDFGGDDTGGYPGLGWDGGGNGPLELLPAAARAAMGRFNDPNHPLDTLGNDSGLAELLAEAFAEAARRGGPSDAGHGEDTGGDPLHGVSAETLAKAARDAPPVDPEWGDWSNPKAHALFIERVGINVVTEIQHTREVDLHHAAQIDVASSLQKFL